MRDCRADELNADQVAPCRLPRLLDGRRHLVGLAVTDAHAAFAIAHHHEGGETESPATLDHGRAAIDLDDVLIELAIALALLAGPTLAAIAALAPTAF